MKRRSFFKSIAAVFGAAAAAPAMALRGKAIPPVELPLAAPPIPKDTLRGLYQINGRRFFIESDGTLVACESESGEIKAVGKARLYRHSDDYYDDTRLVTGWDVGDKSIGVAVVRMPN